MNGLPPISVRSVSKWYGQVIGLCEVDLELAPGITGLLGPNGAGKSTLLKLITGQLRPSLGEVRVFGKPVWRSASARRRIGFAPEVDSFHEEMPGLTFVTTMARLSGLTRRQARRQAAEAVARVGMSAHAHKPMRACSKGMRQRIKIAQALAHDPPVLILDEPLAGIDPPGRLELLDLFRRLRDGGKTLVISSHILEEIEACTEQIVLMAQGRVLVSGTVRSIRDLMDDHPLTVRILCARGRELARELVQLPAVLGVSLARGADENGGESELTVKVHGPEAFFRRFPRLVLEKGFEVKAFEPLDASIAAIFDYLITGSRSRT
ncbi:MAG: ABC transporter ATP-binding protein [Planctomycetes bacterium]|nr:ABC transporter ATP-binding protein [Planctomycetota bacterium]